MASGRMASIRVEATGIARLKNAARLFADADAPFLKAGLEQAGELLANTARGHARGSIASGIEYRGVAGRGLGQRAIIHARHPGSKPMEFGRRRYPAGYSRRGGRNVGGSSRQVPGGQRARPFIGVKDRDAALGEVLPRIQGEIFPRAIQDEWARLLGAGGGG